MARPLSAFEAALVEALNANTKALTDLVSTLKPASAPARAKAKVAQPKAEVTRFKVGCRKPIPCKRTFLPNGVGSLEHTCKGF